MIYYGKDGQTVIKGRVLEKKELEEVLERMESYIENVTTGAEGQWTFNGDGLHDDSRTVDELGEGLGHIASEVDWRADMPNEFKVQIEEYADFVNTLWGDLSTQFDLIYDEIIADIPEHVKDLPERLQRKEFALRVQRFCKGGSLKMLKAGMFAKKDGKDWQEVVWNVIILTIKDLEKKKAKENMVES